MGYKNSKYYQSMQVIPYRVLKDTELTISQTQIHQTLGRLDSLIFVFIADTPYQGHQGL